MAIWPTQYSSPQQIAVTRDYTVWASYRLRDQRAVALKVLCDNPDTTQRGRFENEIRLLARLDHPNIIQVLATHLNEEPPCAVTPLYSGNLRKYLVARLSAELDIFEVIQIVRGLTDAIEYAHSQGVLHRDVKPENILLNSPTDLVVIDFNIALCRECGHERFTESGLPLGTHCYMAPEQLRSPGTVDERADVYSIGVVAFELLGGPVGSSNLDFTAIPSQFRGVLQRATATDRSNRYDCVHDFKRAWANAASVGLATSDRNEITALLAECTLSRTQGERLLSLMEAYADDLDVIDAAFVSGELGALEDTRAVDPFRFDSLVLAWSAFVAENLWPFAYTDNIARRMQKVHTNLICEPQLRAKLLTCLTKLGTRHNRYFVLEVVATLLESIRDQETIAAVCEQLLALDCGDLDALRRKVRAPLIASDLRTVLFTRSNETDYSIALTIR